MTYPKLCVVGAGRLSSRRIYPYLAPAGARVVGVCDLDIEKARQKTDLYGGEAFTDFEEMLGKVSPDGVIVCTGPVGHAALSPIALRKGIPVYTEKPPAPSAAAAYNTARLAAETGVRCTTAFKKRYATAYRRAVEWMGGFEDSQKLSISVDYACAAYPNRDEVSSHLLDFAIHQIDLVSHLFGDVAEVFAFHKDRRAYAVTLRFANGAVGVLNFNDGRSFGVPTEEVEITLSGGNFMTIHNSSVWRITEGEKPKEWREPITFISGGDSGEDTGHLTELAEFIEAIRSESTEPAVSDIYEAYKSMVLYEAIRDSAETGQVVRPSYLPRP